MLANVGLQASFDFEAKSNLNRGVIAHNRFQVPSSVQVSLNQDEVVSCNLRQLWRQAGLLFSGSSPCWPHFFRELLMHHDGPGNKVAQPTALLVEHDGGQSHAIDSGETMRCMH